MAVRFGVAAAATAVVVQHTISIHVDKTKGNSQTGTVEATGSRSSSGTVIPFACFTRHSTTSSKSHYNFFLPSFPSFLLLPSSSSHTDRSLFCFRSIISGLFQVDHLWFVSEFMEPGVIVILLEDSGRLCQRFAQLF